MWNYLFGRHKEIKGIKITHMKAIDTEGSLVIYSEGASGKKVAALKGTTIYELGMRLRTIIDCDKSISGNVVTIIHPESMFYFNSNYDVVEAARFVRQEEEEAKRRRRKKKKKKKESVKKSTSDPLDIEAGHGTDGTEGTTTDEEVDIATISHAEEGSYSGQVVVEEEEEEEEMPKLTLKEIEELHNLDKAAHQHFVCRAVSGYPVVAMKPFVNEFYSRFVEQGSPYVIFEEDVYTVYRLWMNTGLAQASLCRSLVQFLKAKEDLGPLWSVSTMESYLVCNLYNDYERIHPSLESGLSLTKWGQNYTAPEEVHQGIDGKTLYAKVAMNQAHKRARIFALKEVQRLWMYNESKNALLKRMFTLYDDTSTLNGETVSGKEDYRLMNPVVYKMVIASDMYKEKDKIPEYVTGEHARRDISEEQRILQQAIEAQIAASAVHTECWEKVMDPVRKILIEVRDICNQVCINQVRQERPDEKIDFDTSLLRFKGGVAERMYGPSTTEKVVEETETEPTVMGNPPPSPTPTVVMGSPPPTPTVIVGNPPTPTVVVDNPPNIIAYDPDVPHLPTPILERLLMYLNRVDDCMLAAVRYQDPELVQENEGYFSPFPKKDESGEEYTLGHNGE